MKKIQGFESLNNTGVKNVSVENRLESLHKTIETLNATASRFVTRVDSALMPVEKGVGAEKLKNTPVKSHVSTMIDDAIAKIEAIEELLNDAHSRCDL